MYWSSLGLSMSLLASLRSWSSCCWPADLPCVARNTQGSPRTRAETMRQMQTIGFMRVPLGVIVAASQTVPTFVGTRNSATIKPSSHQGCGQVGNEPQSGLKIGKEKKKRKGDIQLFPSLKDKLMSPDGRYRT